MGKFPMQQTPVLARALFAVVDAISAVQLRLSFVRGRILLAAWCAEDGGTLAEAVQRMDPRSDLK